MRVLPSQVGKFHAELDEDTKDNVVCGSDQARIVLATSIAETSLTIPDVEIVIDTGLVRTSAEYHDILQFNDFLASEAVKEQRAGRAGRVKPGAVALIVTEENARLSSSLPHCINSVSRVMELEKYHCRVPPGKLSLCPISDDVSELARQHLQDLALSEDHMCRLLLKVGC